MTIVACPDLPAQPRNPLPPVCCTPFCERGDGHPNEHHPDDQTCLGRSERVRLGWGGRGIETYVMGSTESDPVITFEAESPSGMVVFDLSVEQAERVIAMLTRQVAVAEAQREASR